MLTVNLKACAAGDVLPLATDIPAGTTAHLLLSPREGSSCPPSALPPMPIGTGLFDGGGTEILRVTGHLLLAAKSGPHALECPLCTACMDLPVGEISLTGMKDGFTLAWVTLSDKGSCGQREDQSGPAIEAMIRGELNLVHAQGYLLPDDSTRLRALLTTLALTEEYDLIITTGGTGVGPRDITPQVTERLIDYPLPGFSQAMLQASLEKTPRAIISRSVAGVLGHTLIFNLPGSKRAVLENLESVLPAIGHTLDKLHGDPADCGS